MTEVPFPAPMRLARPWIAKKVLMQFALTAVDRATPITNFVQVGANDGVLDDPIFPFIDAGGWEGVMIEPHPTYFKDLSNTHADRHGIKLVNCAVSDTPGEMELFHVAETERNSFPAWARGCASLKKERLCEILEDARADGTGLDPSRDIASVFVKVRRLDDVLATLGLQSIDFLIVDVEGFELQVLDSVDLSTLNLRAAVVECNGSDAHHEADVAERFAAVGMTTFRLRDDLLAVHPERLSVPLSDMLTFLNQVPSKISAGR
ncbi:MAG: FkbM family methyltransferase [Pseudomonadota bacterium]